MNENENITIGEFVTEIVDRYADIVRDGYNVVDAVTDVLNDIGYDVIVLQGEEA